MIWKYPDHGLLAAVAYKLTLVDLTHVQIHEIFIATEISEIITLAHV